MLDEQLVRLIRKVMESDCDKLKCLEFGMLYFHTVVVRDRNKGKYLEDMYGNMVKELSTNL
jgi:hypothetical protein